MNLIDFLIIFTPIPYFVSVTILYLLTYLRDPLRFIHPHRERGEDMWTGVLSHLNLANKESTPVMNGRRIPKGYVLGLSFAIVAPIGGWILSSFVFSSMLFEVSFSLLFQFLAALLFTIVVTIPSLGSSAHIWKKHMSHIGAPKKRLGSRVLHLTELNRKRNTKKTLSNDWASVSEINQELGESETREVLPSPVTPLSLPRGEDVQSVTKQEDESLA
jgi:hypothetical protein